MVTRGQREVFEAKTRPHLDSLYRTALRLTGQKEAAEDLVQDTCLKAYRSLGTCNDYANYKAWLFRIMMNAHIDHVRRKTEAAVLDADAHGDARSGDGDHAGHGSDEREYGALLWHSGSSVDSDPETSVHNRSFLDHVLRAIDRLPPEVRAVVILAVVEECQYKEIAEILRCPVGTVRSRLSRGRQQLQADLAHYRSHALNTADPCRVGERPVRAVKTGGDE